MRWVQAATLAIVGLALLTGSVPPQSLAPVELWATVERLRTDEVTRTVQIAVRNDGPSPVRVNQLELVTPSFAGDGPTKVNLLIPVGGGRFDIKVPYGTGRCDGGTVAAAAHADLWVRTEDGRLQPVRLALPYPNPLLDRLLTYDCNLQLLAQVVTVRVEDWAVLPDGSLKGSLTVTRANRRIR